MLNKIDLVPSEVTVAWKQYFMEHYQHSHAWATQRGFLTARSARPDTYRAANNILQMALDGKIVMSMRPMIKSLIVR